MSQRLPNIGPPNQRPSKPVKPLPTAPFLGAKNKPSQESEPPQASPTKVLESNSNPQLEQVKTSATLPIGMKIDDRYEISGILGVGGFATVYRAHHLMIDRGVALKVMDLQKGVDPSYTERFFREAKIAAKIHHNNVVSIYDFGFVAETGQPYIAMEMLHGHDLGKELSQNGPLSPNRIFILFRPVLEALGQGHRLGIVHKDLKPENLYLTDPGTAREQMKVLDFGVARLDSAEVSKLTSAGQLLGTPRYLAPEYIKAQRVSPAIDVYQMALIFSEALTGIPAVSGDPFHAMMLHCSGQLQITDFLREGPVGEVFNRATALDPDDRYANCDDFSQAVEGLSSFFESKVPLTGGVPQLSPEWRTSSKIIGANFEDMQSDLPVSDRYSDIVSPYKSSKYKLFILIAIPIGLIIIIAIVATYLLAPKELSVEKIVAPVPEVKELLFDFDSDPPKADIRLKGGTFTICTTPCEHQFSSHDLPTTLVFSAEGYLDNELEISELFHSREHGRAYLELAAIPQDAPKRIFTIDYKPSNARIAEVGSTEAICTSSPCEYVLDPARKSVRLAISASGYEQKNIDLDQAKYEENPLIELELEKIIKAKPVVRKPRSRPAAKTEPGKESTGSSPSKAKAPGSSPSKAKAPEKTERPTLDLL